MRAYWTLVHEEGGAFGVSFPDLPGCISAADSLEAVLAAAEEALAGHLALLRADGDAVPAPRAYAALRAEPDVAEVAADATWHLVPARDVPAPKVRVNITVDPGLLREADRYAESVGLTRSGLIEDALRSATVPKVQHPIASELPTAFVRSPRRRAGRVKA